MTDDFINHFSAVRQTGPGRWLARCPAHEDRSPSLAIRQTDDGRWLIHCFSGCDPAAICTALGLDLSALFPANDRYHRSRERRPFPALDVLQAVTHEITVVLIAAGDISTGRPLSAADVARIQLAHDRLRNAVHLAGGAKWHK